MECLFVVLMSVGAVAVIVWQVVSLLPLRNVPEGPGVTGREGMVGLVGVVTHQIDGSAEPQRGQVRVRGELWSAAAAADATLPLAEGQEVEVVDVAGLTVFVRGYRRT